jgi:hypothetical protein
MKHTRLFLLPLLIFASVARAQQVDPTVDPHSHQDGMCDYYLSHSSEDENALLDRTNVIVKDVKVLLLKHGQKKMTLKQEAILRDNLNTAYLASKLRDKLPLSSVPFLQSLFETISAQERINLLQEIQEVGNLTPASLLGSINQENSLDPLPSCVNTFNQINTLSSVPEQGIYASASASRSYKAGTTPASAADAVSAPNGAPPSGGSGGLKNGNGGI